MDEGRFTWRHNSVLKHLETYITGVRNDSNDYADIPGIDNPSVITGCNDRPDLVISDNNQNIYVVELTIGFETNMAKNCLYGRESDVMIFVTFYSRSYYNKVKYFNLCMRAIGVLSNECKIFHDLSRS